MSTESMIERAAKAQFAQEHGSDGCTWQRADRDSREYWCSAARAAILAALELTDEQVGEIQATLVLDRHFMERGDIRKVLSALRASASVEDGTP